MTLSRIGRYEVQRRLGMGGMGALYLARDPGLDRLVAIKLLKEDLQDDPGLRERFIREARSVARLRHSNIVIVYDVGEDAGRPFMAMEYIAGETLAHVLRQQPSLPVTRRLSMVEDLCAGLAHAHGAGIIHRDIKPANIMFDGDGVLKILDFGIARLGNAGMTQEGMMMGTVNYMSPEQVTGRGVDHRTDIFAAGAVLYEAISLEQAFPGRIDAGVLHRILTEGPVPLNQLVPAIDHELLGIVQRALEREPAQRYQDASAMRRDILRVRRRLMDEGSGQLRDSGSTTIADAKPPTSGPGRKPDSDRPRRLNPERFVELQRQQVADHLRFGEEAFARGEHDAALQHAERAATVDRDSREAFDLIDRARFAIESKAIRQLLSQAQRLLADGHLDDAAALADEASVTFPDVQGAVELRGEVRQIVEKITAAREREQRIASSLERARVSLERGGYETALRAVYEVLSIDPDRAEARALEQEAQTRLQAQREHERARRTAHEQLARARTLADEGKYEEAVHAIGSVTPPSDTVRVAAAEALAFVRAAQRQAVLVEIVAKAREAMDRGRFADVLTAIDSIPAEEQSQEARTLRETADRTLREQRALERKRAALESAIVTIHELLDRGELGPAQERLTSAWAIGITTDERLAALGSRIKHLVDEAEARRQQQVRDRLAAKRVEAARQLLATGDGYAAVALLERDGSSHPLVEQALKEIRAAIAEQEERVRQEADRRRQEEEAKRRVEAEAARKLEEQRKAEEQRRRLDEERRRREAEQQRRREEVATLLVDAERAIAADRPDEATVLLKRADEHVESAEDTELRQRVTEMKASAERLARERLEETRKRDEEARRRERALADLLEKAHSTPTHDEALTLLDQALTLAPTDARVQKRVQERRAALEQQRVEEERARLDARRAQEAEARRREDEARRLEQEAQRAVAAAQAAEEAARLEREREAQRERDAHAAALVEQAHTLFTAGQHEDALTVLRASPVHALTQTAVKELEARRAEIARQRQRKEQQRLQQERRAARVAAITGAVGDRRVQLAGAVVVGVILVLAVWQYWPASAPEVAVNQSPAIPPPAPTSPPARPADVGTAPPPTVPPPQTGTVPSPQTGARGTNVPGVSQPSGAGGRVTVPGNQPTPAPITPPVAPSQPTGGGAPQPGQPQATAAPVDQPVPTPVPEPTVPPQVNPVPTLPAEPRVDLAVERAAIQQIIGRYAAAYGRLDEAELRRIDPGFTTIPSRVLLKSLELTPSGIVIDVDPSGQNASVRFTQNFRYVWNRARMPPTQSGSVSWNLRKVGGEWRVVG